MKEFKKVLPVKFFIIFVTISFICPFFDIKTVFAGSMVADYLVQTGENFYHQGRLQEALREFKKALMAEPDNKEAMRYLQLLEEPQEVAVVAPMQVQEEKILPVTLPKEKKEDRAKGIDKKNKVMEETMKGMKMMISKEIAPVPLEAEETIKEKVSYMEPIERKGGIGLFVNGREVALSEPIIIQQEKIFLPLKEIVSRMYSSVLDLKDGAFRIIFPDGTSREIQAIFINNEPMLSQDELNEYFSVETEFRDVPKEFYITKKIPLQFETYVLEKPEEEQKKEMVMEEITKKSASVPEEPAYIPEKAKPSVQLRGTTTYTYIDYHIPSAYRSSANSITGRFYDFNLDYRNTYKDINGRFDHDYTTLTLSQPDLSLGLFAQSIDIAPLRGQSESFTGLKILKAWDKFKTTLVGGETDNYISGSSGTVKYIGSIYGLKEEFSPLEWLGLKGALFFLENKADKPQLAGTTNFPSNNLVPFAEARLKLPYDLTLSGQIAHCIYEPDNNPDSVVKDWDWRIASDMKKERFNLGLAYELVGDTYASFGNPVSYQDYRGGNLYGTFKVTDKWSLSSSLMQYGNNVADDPSHPTQDNLAFSLYSYHRLPIEQGINLSYSHNKSKTSGVNTEDSRNNSNLYRIDYSFPFLFDIRGLLNYQYFRIDSIDVTADDYYAQTPGISLFKNFSKGSSWYISQQFTKTDYKVADDNINLNTSFNLNYVLNDLFNLYFNSNYSRDRTQQTKASNVLSASTGFKYQVFKDTAFNCEYSIGSHNLDTDKRKWPRNWSIMGMVTQHFDFSTPSNFGIVQGLVFEDSNDNGEWDIGENGIEEVRLFLLDGRETFSDKEGSFKLPYITPGRERVSLDLTSLSAELTTRMPVQEVEVRPRKKAQVNFPVIKACSIQGRVFIDQNHDKLFQENEEPLENAVIIMLPDEQLRRTNGEGEFKFDYLLPGKFKLKINPEDIPVGYELISPEEIEVDIATGEETQNINFILRLKPSTIKRF